MRLLKQGLKLLLILVAGGLILVGLLCFVSDVLTLVGFQSYWLPPMHYVGITSTFGLLLIALSTVFWAALDDLKSKAKS